MIIWQKIEITAVRTNIAGSFWLYATYESREFRSRLHVFNFHGRLEISLVNSGRSKFPDGVLLRDVYHFNYSADGRGKYTKRRVMLLAEGLATGLGINLEGVSTNASGKST